MKSWKVKSMMHPRESGRSPWAQRPSPSVSTRPPRTARKICHTLRDGRSQIADSRDVETCHRKPGPTPLWDLESAIWDLPSRIASFPMMEQSPIDHEQPLHAPRIREELRAEAGGGAGVEGLGLEEFADAEE